MIELGGEPVASSPEELEARLKSEGRTWVKVSGSYRLGLRQSTMRASFSASPAPIGWCGRAIAPS
jgi:hypothetical protein